MSFPFIGEIKVVGFNFAPTGWAFCNGQLLPIAQNQALFSILGTTYGGNGISTFALPNLQGRIPVHPGQGIVLGQADGETSHVLTVAEMPSHNHPASAQTVASNPGGTPTNSVWATSNSAMFGPASDTALNAAAVANTGGNQPHENQAPYLALTFVIALQGIFPSRN
jgi:microcystin-dependent protein